MQRKIRQFKDGVLIATYESLSEACEALGGYKVSNLCAHLRGRNPKTVKGYTFRYVRQRRPKPIDWAPHWRFLYWACHQAIKTTRRELRREAWEYVYTYVVEHLKWYKPASCNPETHIRHSATWGYLRWMRWHYAHCSEVQYEDWQALEEVPTTTTLDAILDAMPDIYRRIAEASLEGQPHERIRLSLHLTLEQYAGTLDDLHDWLTQRSWT